MKKNICKILLIATAMAFGLAGCSAEAKVERQLELGASSMEAGDYDAAIEAYEEVISLDKYEIEGYEGLVAAMIADGRSSEEIEGVVASATDIITELKESEGGLSEEDKAAAERLYISAANAVADDKDAQVAILENGAGVLEESSAIKEAYKEAADENTDETTEDAQDSTDATAEESNTEEVFPVGNTVETEFGSVTRLGDNEFYPDMFEDLEIEYNGQIFQISLPKDMCVKFAWDFNKNVLTIANTDNSKWLYFFFTDFTQPESGKEVCATFTTETFKSAISYDGYTNIPETEVLTTLINEEKLLVNYIGCNIENYYGNVLYYDVYNEQVEDFYEGISYQIYYGETRECDFTADFVVESFKIKGVEESIIENSKPKLNEDGTLIDAEKYGVPATIKLPTTIRLDDVNGRLDMMISSDNKDELIAFLDELNTITPIVNRDKPNETFDTNETIEYLNKYMFAYCNYEYNGNSYNLNICIIPEGYGVTIIKK